MTTTKSLYEIQKHLQSLVLNTNQYSDKYSSQVDAIICEKPPITVQQRLSIYQNGYELRLKNSLAEDFERLEDHLGSDEFSILISSYIKKNPPTTFNLLDYSKTFLTYLESEKPELYAVAIKDWLELLSIRSPEIKNKICAADIASGVQYQICKHPSVFIKKINDKIILSHNRSNKIILDQISQEQFELLRFFEHSQSLMEIENFVQTHSVNFVDIISDFIKNDILYCHKI